MSNFTPAFLILEDGTYLQGQAIGKIGTSGGEICFNTGMTGYQEIYSDPSYFGQIIINTTAHIGNYGVHHDEMESKQTQISGLVVSSFSDPFSRNTAYNTLNEFLIQQNTVGISHLDTRKLVRHIRKHGAMNGVISSTLSEINDLKSHLAGVPKMESLELSSVVSTPTAYELGDPLSSYRIAVLDLGIKKSILDHLVKRGLFCKIFPAKTTYDTLKQWNPDGYFISNGPGDPASMPYAVETVRSILQANEPLFGICLGHQILSLACDIPTYKMHHGHRGLNHPVKNLKTGKSEITSQNHGFAVKMQDLLASDKATLTHVNLNDDTVEGMEIVGKNAFSVQYHPEASPGPHDSWYLFDQFKQLIQTNKH